jgi:hypothetical protein
MDELPKKGGGQPAWLKGGKKKYATDVEIIQALMDTNGHIAKAAKILGYKSHSLRSIVCNNPLLRDAKNEIRDRKLDDAEEKLDEHIYDKDSLPALLEYLKAVGKGRGYGSSIDVNMQAEVNHNVDDSVLGGLMDKFTKKLKEEIEDDEPS